MTAKVFRPGQEDAFRAAARKQDSRILFDGRCVLVMCVFHTIINPIILGERVRAAAAGPHLRLTVGWLERRPHDLAIITKAFVNTDEPIEIVGERMKHVSPVPTRVEVSLVEPKDAEGLWAELHRTIDGGD